MRRIFPLFLLIAFPYGSQAQHQVFELMERTDLSLRDIEERANRYFDSTGRGRGTGYKQFQRWLYERKFHVDENGYFISPHTEWNNFIAARNGMRVQSAASVTAAANWSPLGPSG